ncbi:ATP-dependent DNA ligase [Halalkalibacter oceani]|uniref:ATP-dependent DNA ligase n=1 Tax=Halalkalibacter oceani TaxID=1653776 RepID=UPI0033923475
MFVSPMLLHSIKEPLLEDNDYITELKLDGIRLIMSKFNNKTKLYTRHNNEVTSLFPELLQFDIPDGTVLDGELIALDDSGKPDFELMMSRFKSKKLISQVNIQFAVFDIIYYDNEKIAHLPLLDRKQYVQKAISTDQQIIIETQYIQGNSAAYFEAVKQQDLEGIVVKSINSKYQINKRSHDWLKLINYKYQNVYVAGLRKGEFGVALSDNEGKYLGVMEFMPPQARKYLYKTFGDHVTNETDKFIYLEPYLKCKVKYRNLTKNNLLRISSFVEWVS